MRHSASPASPADAHPDAGPDPRAGARAEPRREDATPAATPFVIIGADGYLAARPATPVQVAHACRAAGYAAAIPASWGDELIADACARRLATRTLPSAVFCACPRVRDRLLGPGPDLLPYLVCSVAPPVATARYLRGLYGTVPIDITYVGACPSATGDRSIDRQVRPEEFFATLMRRGIIPIREPRVFNSFFAPDRRRCYSVPGGLPIDRILQQPPDSPAAAPRETDLPLPIVPRSTVEIRDVEYAAELAQYLIASSPVLIDLAPRLGCACSGAVGGVPVAQARTTVQALEPPRSPTPIVDPDIEVDVELDALEDERLRMGRADLDPPTAAEPLDPPDPPDPPRPGRTVPAPGASGLELRG